MTQQSNKGLPKSILETLKNTLFGKDKSPAKKKCETYRYTSAGFEGNPAIKITSGKYQGVVLHYGKVEFGDTPTGDEPIKLSFQYQVDANPNPLLDVTTNEFITVIGDILTDIVWWELQDPRKGLTDAMLPLIPAKKSGSKVESV